MSRQTIHRVYTEDKRRATIVRVISKQFESFTLQPTTGYYRGKHESFYRAGICRRKEIRSQMAGSAYSRNKSASVRTGDHLERTHEEDYR
jgi:hypothetical protein